VKSLRLCFVLLLAVLLPLRGAFAAGLLCPVANHAAPAEARLVQHAHAHADMEGLDHGHQHHQHSAQVHAAGDTQSHSAGHADAGKCNLCCDLCSVTGLAGAGITVASPPGPAAVFPQLGAPPPSFIAEGEERPPRSI